MNKVGVIGLGLMGLPMAARLAAAGVETLATSRRRDSARAAASIGASWVDQPADLGDCDAVITALPGPRDVELVLFGQNGLLTATSPPRYVVDVSTIGPGISRRLGDRAAEVGSRFLDAPVSGGPPGAQNGTLAIMVGGRREDYDAVLPILAVLGRPRLMGESGAGQATKLANQVLIAGIMGGLHDALALCTSNGLDAADVREAIRGGFGDSPLVDWAMQKILARDMQPGFKISHFLKDLDLALESAAGSLPVAAAVRHAYAEIGEEDQSLGTQYLPSLALGTSKGLS